MRPAPKRTPEAMGAAAMRSVDETHDGAAASRSPSRRSLGALDALTFLMADVRDGIGPFLAVFLKGSQHWSSGDIGLVMGASGVAAALSQIPAGMLVDAARAKRTVIAVSSLTVALGCLAIAHSSTLPVVLAIQVMLALVAAVIPPCLAALSLGIVGHRALPARVSRNESLNHAGNFTAAAMAGLVGQYQGAIWLFYLVCFFAFASSFAVMLIRPSEIDHELARGGETVRDGKAQPLPLADIVTRRDVGVFLATVVFFHFGNAAMLPLAGQMIAKAHPGQDLIGLSACVIAAQLVMMVTASAVGRAMRAGVGRKKIFLVALVVLPIRGLLFAATDNAYAVIGIQILDGISAGIFGVVATIIASDLMRGTGRFSFAQGTIALAVGIGAALSNLTSGFIVDRFGFGAAFCLLAFMALIALVLFAAAMPETLANIRSSSASTIVHIPPAVAAADACEGHRR